MPTVTITFDPAKREWTLQERAIDFLDAVQVFEGRTIDVEDMRRDYGETRIQTIGFLAGRMVMVVWTPRDSAGRPAANVPDSVRHVISMRKCNDGEQAGYRDRLKGA